MSDFFEPPKTPRLLGDVPNLYDFVHSAVYFEGDSLDDEAADERERLFCLWHAHQDIQNGGIAQFLFNSAGDGAEEAVEGFREFGFAELADVLEQAFDSIGPRPVPDGRDERYEWLGCSAAEQPGATMRRLATALQPLTQRYNRLMAAIDAEYGGEGFLWRLCERIEARRSVFFPDD